MLQLFLVNDNFKAAAVPGIAVSYPWLLKILEEPLMLAQPSLQSLMNYAHVEAVFILLSSPQSGVSTSPVLCI